MKSILHSKAVICDSHYVAGQVKRVFSSSGLRPYVVPYGVDHELFTPRKKDSLRQRLDLPPNKKIILNVGSEEPRKNVPTLIRAFRKVLRDGTDAFLVRVGSRESPEVRQLISTAPLKDRVIYLKVSREELAQLYASADVSVFPSFYEGFGLPALEAMASGCPVIASNVASVPEVVGEAGVLLDPFDWEGFAKCMTDILRMKHRAEELSRLGLQRSLQFSWIRTAEETWKIMGSVLDKART